MAPITFERRTLLLCSVLVLGLSCGGSHNDGPADSGAGGNAGGNAGPDDSPASGGAGEDAGGYAGADDGPASGGAGENAGGYAGANDGPANGGAGEDAGGHAGANDGPASSGAGGHAGENAGGYAGGPGAGTVTLNVSDVGATFADRLLYVKLVAGAADCSTDTSAGAYSAVEAVTAGTCEIVMDAVAPGAYTACAFVDADGNAQPSPGDLVGQLSLTVSGDTNEDWSASDWLTLPGADAGVPDSGQQPEFITWTYNGQPVGLYLPDAADDPLPVVMFLHGYTNDPIASPPWIVAAINAIEPCAVFVPFRPEEEGASAWGGTYDAELRPSMVDALAELDRVIEEQSFDTQRQYLYGESMGAEGVFMLLVQFPTRFAGAVAVAGYTLDTGASEMAQTPLWILHGSDDTVNPTSSSQTIYASILEAGGTQVTYTEYPGLEHSPAIVRAREEPGLLEWLLAQRRN
jgi:predicted esterase